MDHKEKLEYLKKHDPIAFYDLTSDPTGAGGSDSSGCIAVLFWTTLIVVSIVVGMYFRLKG